MLYLQFTIFYYDKQKKTLKSGVESSSSPKKYVKTHNLCHPLTKYMQTAFY